MIGFASWSVSGEAPARTGSSDSVGPHRCSVLGGPRAPGLAFSQGWGGGGGGLMSRFYMDGSESLQMAYSGICVPQGSCVVVWGVPGGACLARSRLEIGFTALVRAMKNPFRRAGGHWCPGDSAGGPTVGAPCYLGQSRPVLLMAVRVLWRAISRSLSSK